LVSRTDCWPTATKLKKGEYVARLQLRHEDANLLEKFEAVPLGLDRTLAKPIAVKAYPDFNSAIAGKGDFGAPRVKGGVRKPIYFALPVDEKLPDSVKHGDLLLGQATYGEPAPKALGKKERGGFEVQFAVTAPKPEEKKIEPKEEDSRTNAEKLTEALRDTRVKHLEALRKWPTKDEHAALVAELLKEHASHLPIHLERLKAAEELKDSDEAKAAADEPARLRAIVAAADALLAVVDVEGLATQLGRRTDKDDAAAAKKRKDTDKTKEAVVTALSKKVVALAQLAGTDGAGAEDVVAAYKLLAGWVDVTEAKYGRITAAREKVAGRLGLALAALNKHIAAEATPKRELFEERVALLEDLGWTAWVERERLSLVGRYPQKYALF